jgi:hypothetical protein
MNMPITGYNMWNGRNLLCPMILQALIQGAPPPIGKKYCEKKYREFLELEKHQ